MTVQPPAHAIFLDTDHAIVYVEYKGERAGLNEWHRKADGSWCRGWVAFNGAAWARGFSGTAFQGWDIVQSEPLTLTPSLQCRACPSHGFITGGKWVPA